MQPELALQKLNELRQIVDGDMEDMVDTLANVMMLKQDMSNPMYGAKVTYHRKPEGEWVDVDKEDLPQSAQKQVENGKTITDYSEIDRPWMWRATKMSGESLKESYLDKIGKSEDDVWFELKKWMAYTEKEKVPRDEVPEPLDPEQPLEEDVRVAEEELDGDWTIYEGDFREYRVRRLVEPEGLEHVNAIVYDPMVSSASAGKLWDPNKEEYMKPSDYPMGTVNVIVADGGELGKDYVSDVKRETSIPPADGEPEPHSYSPGWQ